MTIRCTGTQKRSEENDEQLLENRAKGERLIHVSWIPPPVFSHPSGTHTSRAHIRMARLVNQEKYQVAYGHIEKHSLQPHHVHDEIDERDAPEVQKRTTRKHILGNH
jgi:nicotinamidase-related amidase